MRALLVFFALLLFLSSTQATQTTGDWYTTPITPNTTNSAVYNTFNAVVGYTTSNCTEFLDAVYPTGVLRRINVTTVYATYYNTSNYTVAGLAYINTYWRRPYVLDTAVNVSISGGVTTYQFNSTQNITVCTSSLLLNWATKLPAEETGLVTLTVMYVLLGMLCVVVVVTLFVLWYFCKRKPSSNLEKRDFKSHENINDSEKLMDD
jgi:hypothetical protein